LLGEEAADAADGHPEGHSGSEQVTGAQRVRGQPLGHVHTQPCPHQAAEDRTVAVEPLLGQARVLAQVDVLEPGAQAHEDCATDERTHHDVQDPFVGLASAARLVHEDPTSGQHAHQHEESVGVDREVHTEQVTE
jgi:hypothetical protein